MKLNKIFMALAATAMVGCSSEDVSEFSASTGQAIEDARLVELTPDFVIAGVGVEGATTRTHWEQDPTTKALVNKFLPIWKTAPTGGNKIYDYGLTSTDADLEAQAVGLCWLGQGAAGTDVYTNYQFYHFGWLNNDETKAKVECNQLMNGSLYSDITAATGTANAEAVPGIDWTTAGIPAKSLKAGADNLNYNSGVYKTDNKAIFGGDYIVYYPFNPDFKDAGTIPAIAETTFNNVSESFGTKELGHATFRYSAPVTIAGGDQAADFGMYNLSSLVQLRVATPVGDAFANVKQIDQIVLFSASGKLLKQANLAADKIVAGKKGAELYASTEGTKTITANFAAAVTLQATNSTTPKPTSAYITVLPTTVEDLVVLVHNVTDGTWARVDLPNTVFEAGKAKRLDITVASTDFKSEFIAVDEASLIKARNEARAAVGLDATAKPVISVIGDITLDGKTTGTTEDPTADQYDFNNAADANITIKGDDIIIPEDISLVVKFMTIESDIRVLGKSCCDGTRGGQLYVHGSADGTTLNNVIMEPTKATVNNETDYDTYNPYVAYLASAPSKAIIAAGKTFDVQAGRVVVAGAVQHKGDIKIAEGAKLTVNGTTGDLQFMGSKVTNDGTIEVKKDGKFDITDKDGNASATDGKNMTNNGKFIHNVDAGVGTAVQLMQQNGEYRCRVDDQIKLDDAFLQWTACSVIEMVEPTTAAPRIYNLGTAGGITPAAYKHNGKYIDIEVNATSLTTFNNPVVASGNGDSQEIQIGNLTVAAGGLDIDYVTGTGKRTLTVNGDMAVKANTNIVDSKKITVTKNLTVSAGTLTFEGAKANEDGLAVTGDITVSGATFDAGAGTVASDVDALNITAANFYLENGATATFGNRNDGAGKNLVVSGTISNPAGCTFNIVAANQVGSSVLAWVTCTKLEVGGTFSAARPRVVAAE